MVGIHFILIKLVYGNGTKDTTACAFMRGPSHLNHGHTPFIPHDGGTAPAAALVKQKGLTVRLRVPINRARSAHLRYRCCPCPP